MAAIVANMSAHTLLQAIGTDFHHTRCQRPFLAIDVLKGDQRARSQCLEAFHLDDCEMEKDFLAELAQYVAIALVLVKPLDLAMLHGLP